MLLWVTPVFPSGLVNLKRNPDEILVWIRSLSPVYFRTSSKSCWVAKKGAIQEADQNQLVPIALSEITCIRSRGHRLMILYTGREWARWLLINRRQVLIPAECEGFQGYGGFHYFLRKATRFQTGTNTSRCSLI